MGIADTLHRNGMRVVQAMNFSGLDRNGILSSRWILPAPFPFIAGLLVGLALIHPAHAATFTVTKTEDTADGVCDGDCSLREAIIAANASAGPDNVVFDNLGGAPDLYTLTIANFAFVNEAEGDLDIVDDLNIIGNGAANTVVQGGLSLGTAVDRVLMLLPKPSRSMV